MEPDAVTATQARLDGLGELFYASIGEVWQQRAAPDAPAAGGQPGAAAPDGRLGQDWAARLGAALLRRPLAPCGKVGGNRVDRGCVV